MVRYNAEILIKIANRDKCDFLNIPDNLSSATKIEFVCSCGDIGRKNIVAIYKLGGAFCKTCTIQNSYSKRDANYKRNQTVKNAWESAHGAPHGYWNARENVCAYVEWLGNKLQYTNVEDWYNVSQNDFNTNKGIGVLGKFDHSYLNVLCYVFPDFQFLPWKFTTVPNGFWTDFEHIKQYLDWLYHHLGYTELYDWVNIHQRDFTMNYGCGLLFNKTGKDPLKS